MSTPVQSSSRLMVLLFSDIVGSTQLKSDLGTRRYADLLARHDRIFKRLIETTPGAQILKDMGDGYFASFATGSDAVRVALLFQYLMAVEPWGEVRLSTRVGIHLGEIVELDLEVTGKPKVIGLAADLTARVMSLGLGGQILLTRSAFDDARQFVSSHPQVDAALAELSVGPAACGLPGPQDLTLQWIAHGPYVFKGSDDRMEVFEVGAKQLAPLTAPPDAEKARRAVSVEQQLLLGWRPAVALPVPGREKWELVRRLGEGGFGEVWLARHVKLNHRRVFKFCYDVERLRSFKREITLFRLLREVLGDRPDIARLHEIRLDQAPFFLESDYTEGGDLADWAAARGGIATVPLGVRLDIVARLAEATAAAHSVGIFHKDIKPSNILMYEEDGQPRPRLADFGIGVLGDTTAIERQAITVAGFTQLTQNDSSRTGTRLYSPPELLVGKPFTIQGDVYSLGVLLYQMVVADLERPLGVGWERDVTDPLLRDDIAACVDVDPAKRLASAAELSHRLRKLEVRRGERQRKHDQERVAVRRRRVLRLALAACFVAVAMLTVAGAGYFRERRARGIAERERENASIQARKSKAVVAFLQKMLATADPTRGKRPNVTVRQMLDETAAHVEQEFAREPEVLAVVHATLGRTYFTLGQPQEAITQLRKGLAVKQQLGTADDLEAAEIWFYLSQATADRTGFLSAAEAEGQLARCLEIRQRLLPPDDELVQQAASELAFLKMLTRDREVGEEMWLASMRPYMGNRSPAEARAYLVSEVAQARFLWQEGKRDAAHAVLRAVAEPMLKSEAVRETVLEGIGQFALRQIDREDFAGAEAVIETALQLARELNGEDHAIVAWLLAGYGKELATNARAAEGIQRLREAVEIASRALAPDHPAHVQYRAWLAGALAAAGQTSEAEAERDRILTRLASLPPLARVDGLASFLQEWVHVDPRLTARMAAEGRELARREAGPADPLTFECTWCLAEALAASGQWDEAEALCVDALAELRDAEPGSASTQVLLLTRLGDVREHKGDTAGSERAYREALRIFDPQSSPTMTIVDARWRLAKLVYRRSAGDYREADALLEQAVRAARRTLGSDSKEYEQFVRDVVTLVRDARDGGTLERKYSGHLALALVSREKFPEAESLLRRQLIDRDRRPAGTADSEGEPDWGLELAHVLLARDQPVEAAEAVRLEMARWTGPDAARPYTPGAGEARSARAQQLLRRANLNGASADQSSSATAGKPAKG